MKWNTVDPQFLRVAEKVVLIERSQVGPLAMELCLPRHKKR